MPIEANQAEALKELVALASQARGLEIATLDNVAGLPGVPEKIVIGIRHGTTPEAVDLSRLFEAYRDRPTMKRGIATALTLASFIDLANRHSTPHSVVFAKTDWRKPELLAVIDYHEKAAEPVELIITPMDAHETEAGDPLANGLISDFAGTYAPRPDNLKHRIAYAYPLSDTWKAWVEKDGEVMSQGDFAEWIEDHIADLTSPEDAEKIWLERDFQTTVATPSGLIQISRGLQINVEAKVKNVVTLQSGAAQIAFEENHLGSDGKPLTIPGLFLLQVAPFAGGEKIRVPVRLRYRVVAGQTRWFFSMHRPDIYITERLTDDIATVAEKTALPVYEGAPEV